MIYQVKRTQNVKRPYNFSPAKVLMFDTLILKNLILGIVKLLNIRKYPLRRYILGLLTHTTAWDQHWGGDETLKLVLVYIAWLLLF